MIARCAMCFRVCASLGNDRDQFYRVLLALNGCPTCGEARGWRLEHIEEAA